MEVAVKEMLHEVGGEVLRQWLEAQDAKYPADKQPCECGQQADYVRRREGVALTLSGRVHYRRGYYFGVDSPTRHSPFDQPPWIPPPHMRAIEGGSARPL